MNYSLADYGTMLRDSTRVQAYLKVIENHAADKRVLDLGCGTGFFTLACLESGAAHVDAVDVNPVAGLVPEFIRQNWNGNNWEVFVGDIKDFNTDPYDLIIADLRSSLPFYGSGLETMKYVSNELLNPGGLITPTVDRCFFALVDIDNWRAHTLEPFKRSGHDVSVITNRILNTPTQMSSLEQSRLMSSSFEWANVDYRDMSGVNSYGNTFGEVTIDKDGSATGVACWFSADLLGEASYSTMPGSHQPTYGRMVLPLEEPLDVSSGATVSIKVNCKKIGTNWIFSWEYRNRNQHFKQHSFDALTASMKSAGNMLRHR